VELKVASIDGFRCNDFLILFLIVQFYSYLITLYGLHNLNGV
jgi:hypothetical protein